MRGPCGECLTKDRVRAHLDRIATPKKLIEHPDLAEIEAHLNEHYDPRVSKSPYIEER